MTWHFFGASNGISQIGAPIDSLTGVFLGPLQPSLSPAPATLTFFSGLDRDFDVLNPALRQAFFIGDGLRLDQSSIQRFVVPQGATRLYLGIMDAYGWAGNSGAFEVTVSTLPDDPVAVPEPELAVLVGVGCAITSPGRRMKVRRRCHVQ